MKQHAGWFGLAVFSAAVIARAQSPEMPSSAVSASETHTNGMLRVSGEFINDGHYGWKLFDRNFNNKWLTSTNEKWALYQFANGDRWAVTNYVLSSGGDSPNRDPRIWRIEGANDLKGGSATDIAAATWRLVDAQEMAAQFPGRNAQYPFPCGSNATAYNAYRLTIDSTFGDNMVQIGDWMMEGNAGAAQFYDTALASKTDTSATFDARLAIYDANETFTAYALCAATDWGSDAANWPAGSDTLCTVQAGGVINLTLPGLTPDSPYVVRFHALNANGTIEAWTDAIPFTTYTSEPQVVTRPAEAVGARSATLSGDFIFAGGQPTATVTLYWATAAQTNNWFTASSYSFTPQTPALLTHNLTNLELATTYYFRHYAHNGTTGAWSSETLEFTTLGLPVFGTPVIAGFQDEVRVGIALTSIGAAADATVSLWQGASPATLVCVETWPATSAPCDYTFVTNITQGATQCFVFRADSILPNTPPSPAFVETEPLYVTQNNRVLTWKNPTQNTVWNTVAANWDASGTTTFTQGDSVVFNNPPNNTSVTLTQDIIADAVTMNMNANWTLNGAYTLDLHSGLNINARNANLFIDTPRVSGPGSLALNKGNLQFSNPANDYTGGTTLTEGRLTVRATADNATPLGSGDVTLGTANDPTATANLVLTRPNSATPFALNFAGDLAATGGNNTALITLDAADDAAAAISAHFNALGHEPGGSMVLTSTRNFSSNPGGINEYLFLDNPPAGIFPPWFVINRSGGSYATHDPARGVVRATLPINQIPYDGSPTRFEGLTLSADTSIDAADVWYTFNLNGRTLNLGKDGIAGMIVRGGANITNSVPASGGINLAGNELYLYNEQGDAYIRVPINGTVRKFGDADLNFSHSIPTTLHNQQGRISFRFNEPSLTTASALRGAGTYHTRDTATDIIFQGHDAPLRFHHLEMVGGTLTLTQGNSLIYGHAYLGPDASGYQGNSSHMVLRDTAQITINNIILGFNSRHNTLTVTGGATLTGTDQIEVGAYGPYNHMFINGNGAYILNCTYGSALRLGVNSGSLSNTVEVANNGRFTSTGGFYIGDGGSYNTFTARDNAAISIDSLIIGMSGSSRSNLLFIADNATFTTRGNLEVGANGSYNTLVISNGLFTSTSTSGESLRIGTHSSHSNRVELAGTGRFLLAGDARVGGSGSFNTLRVADDSLFTSRNLTLSESTSVARSNQVVFAGGKIICTNLYVNATSILSPEIQTDGLRNCALFRNVAIFANPTYLRPTAVRSALPGEYAVLHAENGITNNGLLFDPPPDQLDRWKWRISDDQKTLYIKLLAPRTLFMVR